MMRRPILDPFIRAILREHRDTFIMCAALGFALGWYMR